MKAPNLMSGQRPVLMGSLIFLACCAVYFNLLANGFVMDDYPQVLENSWIRSARYLPEIFSSNFAMGEKSSFYRPVVHVFYMISYYLFGLKPWGFHLMSMLFHAGVSVLVFLTLRRLLVRVSVRPEKGGGTQPLHNAAFTLTSTFFSPPFVAALLFATHPIHTEAVAWISVTDLYMTFFYLLSFYFYIRSSEEGSSGRAAYAFSVVSFFLATLCKEPALTLPAMLVVYDYVYRKEGEGILYYVKRYIPFLIAGGVYFSLRVHALGGMVTFRTPLTLSPYEYLVAVLALFRKYMEKLLVPVNLNVWHVFQPPASLFSFSGMVSLVVAVAFLIGVIVAIRKKRAALLGFTFILLPLLPALYLPGLTQGLENAFTERYLYLPSFGFILLVALLIARIREKAGARWGAVLTTVLAVTILLYASGSIIRNTAWRDNYSIWADAVRKSPSSMVPLNGLGDAAREKGLIDEAIQHYLAALKVDPGNPFSHASLGLAYADKGSSDRAVRELRTALDLKPDYAEAHDFLGVVYGSLGQTDRAITEFETALKLKPELDYVYKHLGIAYNNAGMTDKAIESFQTALRLNPEDTDAHNNLGVTYAERGMMEQAAGQFEEAVRLNPADASLHYNAARAYQALGRADMAARHLSSAQGIERANP